MTEKSKFTPVVSNLSYIVPQTNEHYPNTIMRKLHIAMLSIHSSPLGRLGIRDTGGMSIYVRELARGLDEGGHQVDIFTAKSEAQGEPIISLYQGVRLVYVGTGGGDEAATEFPDTTEVDGIAANIEAFRRRTTGKYDLIHSNYWLSGRVGEILKSYWCCPHVITFHTLASAKLTTAADHVEHSARLEQEQHLVKTCDIVLAPTATERRRLVDLNGRPTDRIHILGCGVDLQRFKPLPQAEKGLPGEGQRDIAQILFVGRFDPMKGLSDLLQSFTLLPEQPYGVELVLVGGDGPDSKSWQNLVAQAEKLGLREHVHFLGRVEHEQLTIYYNKADIVVIPSRYESFGLVALEALACGTPVAATRVGVAADIIEPGVNGYLADPGDPATLASAIHSTLALMEKGDRQRIRSTAENFGWENVANDLIDVYNNSLNT